MACWGVNRKTEMRSTIWQSCLVKVLMKICLSSIVNMELELQGCD